LPEGLLAQLEIAETKSPEICWECPLQHLLLLLLTLKVLYIEFTQHM
jgi:hypothetical protein